MGEVPREMNCPWDSHQAAGRLAAAAGGRLLPTSISDAFATSSEGLAG
jgi:hypothetical protein